MEVADFLVYLYTHELSISNFLSAFCLLNLPLQLLWGSILVFIEVVAINTFLVLLPVVKDYMISKYGVSILKTRGYQ